MSSRTDLYDDVVDATSFSALDVVEIKTCFSLSASLSGLDVLKDEEVALLGWTLVKKRGEEWHLSLRGACLLSSYFVESS